MRGPGARSHKETLSRAHTVCVCVLSGGTLKVHAHLKLEVGITIIIVCCQVEVWPELYPLLSVRVRLSLLPVCHMLQGLCENPDQQCREASACSAGTREQSPGETCAQLFPFLPSAPLKPQQSHL